MFHEGDLQSGIGLAIQEQKLVACFVREDDNDDCSMWEESYLASIKERLSSKAVVLRIASGSQGASFLSAFCPISKVPTLVIINNGQVLEKLEGGISEDEFRERIGSAIGVDVRNDASSSPKDEETTTEIGSDVVSESTSQQPLNSEASHSRQESQNITKPPTNHGKRPMTDQSEVQAAEKARLAAEAQARRKEANDAEVAEDKDPKQRSTGEIAEKEKARQSWIMQQKQRKDEARQERKRILDQIERDKQDRKARAQQEKASNEASASSLPSDISIAPSSSSRSKQSTTSSGVCNLQIRLFDGSSIRNRFAPSATLASEVRDWIKISASENAPGAVADAPYTFRQILAPGPSRSIEISEEHQSLRDLSLVPNATLVLVPVSGYTEAYTSGNAGGYVGMATGAAQGVIGGVTKIITTALSFVPGFATGDGGGAGGEGAASSSEGGNAAGSTGTATTTAGESSGLSSSSSAKIKVKTIADQRAEAANKEERRPEFYNGNSSAFQGRKDENDGGGDDDDDGA